MRAKFRPFARGLTALVAVGVAAVTMSVGSSTATATQIPHAVHIAVGSTATQSAVLSPGDWTWS